MKRRYTTLLIVLLATVLHAQTVSNETSTLTFVDVFGRIVMTQKITTSENRLKVSNFPNGVHTVILSNSSGKSVGKFVKQQRFIS